MLLDAESSSESEDTSTTAQGATSRHKIPRGFKGFDINKFIEDGFEKVCDVKLDNYSGWVYYNINTNLMYADHKSWIYVVVENDVILKLGETGNPLGIRESQRYHAEWQPKGSSVCRLGRLRKGDGTDYNIRESLRESIDAGNEITIWARACPIDTFTTTVAGKTITVKNTIHKSLEELYLKHFSTTTGMLPFLNKSHK
jgi:hypothetical protein